MSADGYTDLPYEAGSRKEGVPTFCPKCKARSGFGFRAGVCPFCDFQFGTKPQLAGSNGAAHDHD